MEQSRLRRVAPLLVAWCVVAFAYVWTVRSNNLRMDFGRPQHDYYTLLVHGFLRGQLSLDVEVPRELRQVADPYDPAARPEGVELHDASLYHGRYYIYYGVVPAAVLLLPFRVVTGVDLPLPVAALIFALVGYSVALWTVADVRRRHFPRAGAGAVGLLAVALGFVSCLPVLLRRSSMYELPIVSGGCFAMIALACFWAALTRPARRWAWLAGCSPAWGLAIGCRPTYLLAPLSLLLGWRWYLGETGANRTWAKRMIMAAVVPLGVVGLLLAWYNQARFGRIGEFGLRYILSGVYEAKIEHFELRYVPWNAHAYLWAPGEWGRYFPFFHERAITAARPDEHYGMDHPFGLLVNLPLLWLAGFAFAAAWRARGGPRGEFVRFTGALAWVAVTLAGFLFCFYAAMARYLGDFAPELALLAVVGGLAVVDRAAACAGAWRRRVAGSVVGGLAALSTFVAFVFSVEIYDRVRAYNAPLYATLQRVLNAPVHWIEGFGVTPGAVTLRVRLPAQRSMGRTEELLRTGWTDQTDRISITYLDALKVAFTYEHAGAAVVRSGAIELGSDREHVVRIAMGSLMPPASWPNYRSWSAPEAARAQHHLEVRVDGIELLSRHQRFYAASTGTVVTGGRGAEVPFSGRIVAVEREPAAPDTSHPMTNAPVLLPPRDGVWRLRVRFPDGPLTEKQPLIVSGETGRGDLLVVELLSENEFRLLWDHWGNHSVFSPPIAYVAGRDYLIQVSHPVYRAGDVENDNGPGELVVTMDQRPVWRVAVPAYAVAPDDLYVGSNPIGGSTCAERFAGSIEVVK